MQTPTPDELYELIPIPQVINDIIYEYVGWHR